MRDVDFEKVSAEDVADALIHDADVMMNGTMTLGELADKFAHISDRLGRDKRVWFGSNHSHEIDISLVPGQVNHA